jgi:hypothetical protein
MVDGWEAIMTVISINRAFRSVSEDVSYPLIRSAVAPEYAELPAEDLEAVLRNYGIEAAAMEGFFDDVGHAFSSAGKAIGGAVSTAAPVVGRIATRALPGVISGATTGAALGPWGALAGAVIGGTASALAAGGGAPSARSAGAPPSRSAGASDVTGALGGIASAALPALAGLVPGGSALGNVASAVIPAITGGAPASGGNPAGVLLGLIQRPEVIHSLMSMALGPAGRKDVPVGGTPVPVGAFANLLTQLGSHAFGQAEATAEPTSTLPRYLYSTENVLVADPSNPVERAGVLLQRLGEAWLPTAPARVVPQQRLLTEADEYYDAIDIAELDSLEMEVNDLELDD